MIRFHNMKYNYINSNYIIIYYDIFSHRNADVFVFSIVQISIKRIRLRQFEFDSVCCFENFNDDRHDVGVSVFSAGHCRLWHAFRPWAAWAEWWFHFSTSSRWAK